MRLGGWARLLCLVTPFFAGCAGFWVSPTGSSSGGCTSNCSTSSSGNFYILNTGSSPGILGEKIAAGKLTAINGSPWTPSSTPFAMAMDSTGSFLYVSTTSGIYVYPISSGALGTPTQVDGNDVTSEAIIVDGPWLVAANQGSGQVTFSAAPINTSNGLNNGSVQVAGFTIGSNSPSVQPGKMVISPDGKNIFVALGTGGMAVIPFFPSTAAGSNPFGSSAWIVNVSNNTQSVKSVAVDPGQNVFYFGETNAASNNTSGAIFAFLYSSIGAGTPTQISGSPIASGGLAPNAILPIGSATAGSHIYVANGTGAGSSGNIASFSVTSASAVYTIATGSTIAAGVQPISLAADSSGTFLLDVNNIGGPFFSSYTFDATTAGKLDEQVFANTGASPQQIVAVP